MGGTKTKTPKKAAPKKAVQKKAVPKKAVQKKADAKQNRVVIVYQSGGDYDARYVENLIACCRRFLSFGKYSFDVYTDCADEVANLLKSKDTRQMPTDVALIELDRSLPGWWCKLEIFTETPEEDVSYLYLDLDTIIVAKCVVDTLKQGFCMLEAFNRHRRWASGAMLWKNVDLGYLIDDLDDADRTTFYEGDQLKFEQNWIVEKSESESQKIESFNARVSGNIISYRHNALRSLPSGTSIVCFHGHPRPHEAQTDWVQECWK